MNPILRRKILTPDLKDRIGGYVITTENCDDLKDIGKAGQLNWVAYGTGWRWKTKILYKNQSIDYEVLNKTYDEAKRSHEHAIEYIMTSPHTHDCETI